MGSEHVDKGEKKKKIPRTGYTIAKDPRDSNESYQSPMGWHHTTGSL
jgi:hypothetical protein